MVPSDLFNSLSKDLIGPYLGDEVIKNEDPVGYYISGILYPRDMGNPAPEEDKEDNAPPDRMMTRRSYPSGSPTR